MIETKTLNLKVDWVLQVLCWLLSLLWLINHIIVIITVRFDIAYLMSIISWITCVDCIVIELSSTGSTEVS